MSSEDKSAVMWQNVITAHIMFLETLTLLPFIIVQQGNNLTNFF